MAKDLWIAVPTYWTHASSAPGEETTVFDHPTPLDEEGTLPRTLESFARLEGDFKVLIVAAVAHPSLGEAVHERVSELLAPYAKKLELYLASPARLGELNSGLPEPILGPEGYGNIRNVQLVVPYALGADAVVGIDDDEIIEDVSYLEKVSSRIGEPRAGGGEVVLGMAGPYYDSEGEWRIAGADELAAEPNIFLKKNHFMNEAIRKAMDGVEADGLVRSNVAFGGNMVMARETIACTPHDPYIPRGEDYDYVINAAMAGIFFCFQPAMAITHLPPDSTGSQAADKASKLIADIRRFIYMREKMRLHAERYPEEVFDRDYVMPYPGPYLDEAVDLPAEATRALDAKYPEFRQAGSSPEDLVGEAVEVARGKAEEFFSCRESWRRTLAEVEGASRFRAAATSLGV
ncbi:MAG: hypothetical protein ACYTGB_06130 [Planctomycetota bacterium]|jgi:hypothetical protein